MLKLLKNWEFVTIVAIVVVWSLFGIWHFWFR